MSYFDGNGKFQKAHDFLFKKLVPPQGQALNELGEALRILNRIYNRYINDGDSYGDCIEYGIVNDLSKKIYPFDKEYHGLGSELDNLLSNRMYDDSINLVLVNIMLSLSSTSNIYNPNTNRLVPIESTAGKNALKLLDLNSIFINYCGKNEEWLPENLREKGVKITKTLSEETRKELKCDTIQEFHREYKLAYGNKKSVKVSLSKDNTVLSKKFSKINREHKRSVKAHMKKNKEIAKRREKQQKKIAQRKVKDFNETKLFHQVLKDLTVSKRVDGLKKMNINKITINSMVKMTFITLSDYKEKKVTTKTQRDHKKIVVEKLVKALNESGDYVLTKLNTLDSTDSLFSYQLSLSDELDKKIDDMLVDILGSSEAVDDLYFKCCR